MEGPSEASKSQPQEQKPAQGKIEEREENPIDKIREQLLSMQFEPKHIQQALSKTQNLDKAIQIIISLLEDGDTQQKYKIDEAELVILVRMDLKMGLGKIAAQNAHATLKAFLQCRQRAQSDDGYSFTFIEWLMKQHLENSSSSSITAVDTEYSFIEDRSSERRQNRKFNRSGSGSRSKERGQDRQTFNQPFFIKNICKQVLQDCRNGQKVIDQRAIASVPVQLNKHKRELTPVKERRFLNRKQSDQDQDTRPIQREVQWLKMERKLHELTVEREMLLKKNRTLQWKIKEVQLCLEELGRQNNFLIQKIKDYQKRGKGEGLKDNRSNVLRLKKQIIERKESDGICAVQQIAHEGRFLQAENLRLKQVIKNLQQTTKQLTSQRQVLLEQTVQKLKEQMKERDREIIKISIRLNVMQVKQTKEAEKAEINKKEEINKLKKKYGKIASRYLQMAQEITVNKRISQRKNLIFSGKDNPRQSLEALTLSPSP